jgi:lipoyl(octanoyl) transferase
VADAALQVYLLGSLAFEAAQGLQRRLVYQVAGERTQAALMICEHPPLITVGRQGSRTHILSEPEELRARRWPVRWVNRGGGCWLHLPGQLAIYPIVALDQLGLGVQEYLNGLQQVLVALLADFDLRGEVRPDQAGVWVGGRPIAGVGVAVRDWVAYYGVVLNVSTDLEPFRRVRTGADVEPMTSLERERRGRLPPALVRQRLLEHFAACFHFDRLALFFDHPSLSRKATSDALTASM